MNAGCAHTSKTRGNPFLAKHNVPGRMHVVSLLRGPRDAQSRGGANDVVWVREGLLDAQSSMQGFATARGLLRSN